MLLSISLNGIINKIIKTMTSDQKKIEEGNRLIAKFKGWFEEEGGLEGTWYEIQGCGKYVAFSTYKETYRDLPFHRSWEWLMPVVLKINQWHTSVRPFVYGAPESCYFRILEDKVKVGGNFWTNPNTVNGNYWSYLRKTFKYSKYSELEAVWLAVVEFIKWYNASKEKNSTT